MRKSITTRYFKTTAILLLSSIFLLGIALMFFASRYFRSDRERMLSNNIDSAAQLMVASIYQDGYINRTTMESIFSIISTTNDSVLFFTWPNGQTAVCSEGRACVHSTYMMPPDAMNQVLSNGQYSELGTLSGLYDTSHYTVGKPVLTEDGVLIGVLFASSNASSLTVFLNDLLSMFIVSAGVMLFVSSLLSVWLTQRLTTPLRTIADAARSYGKGDFSARVPVEGDDEIAQLSLTFNNMAQGLEANEESRSTFIDNVAHELRTPMTSIKGFIDGILDGTIPPEQQDHYLEIVSQEVGRLARLTRSMLDVTKLEKGEYNASAKVYDIWETITGVAFGAEKRIAEKNIRIEGLAPQRTLVYADPDIVYQVVFNLVDNAVKFAGQNGVVTFRVQEKQGRVYVGIKNTGEGIPKEDIPHIFDRFYKADKSRSLHVEGAGLGLYICKKLINRSGGDIMVRSKQGEFTEFVFNLPVGVPEKSKTAKV